MALDHFEGTCGFGVAGAQVKQVWAPISVYAESGNRPHSWKLHSGDGNNLEAPAPVLLELEDGQFAALTALPDFIGTVLCDKRGVSTLIYHYVSHGQPIPYDIALLAQLQGDLKDGVYVVNVPEVSERPPRTTAEKIHRWSYQETRRATGIVGGVWPWLRQGWPLLNDPSDQGSRLIHHGLRDIESELRPGRFATVDAAGAMKLTDMFQLVERTPPPSPTMPMTPQGAPLVSTQVTA